MSINWRQRFFAYLIFLSLIATLFLLATQINFHQIYLKFTSLSIPTADNTLPSVYPTPQIFEEVKIIRIIDGDTVVDDQNRKIRLIGINTPELDKNSKQYCFATSSAQKISELIFNKTIRLEKDVSETDKYGRLLRYLWLNNQMINQTLIELGLAQVDTVPPDVKYQQLFVNSQKQSQLSKNGLWGPPCHD